MTGHHLGPPPPPGPAPPARAQGLRGVLFDMDGLLVDSEPLWFEAERAVMTRLGGEWAPEDQHALLGSTLPATVTYMLAKAPDTGRPVSRQQVSRWLVASMTGLLRRGVPLRPGAAELVAAVAAAEIPHALVTSSQRPIMQAVLTATGMAFEVTVCGDDVRQGKPHPEPYLRAAALLGQPPGGCVVLEDSPAGIASAQAAGCPVVAVPSLPLPASARDGRGNRGDAPRAPVTVGSLCEVDLVLLREMVAKESARAVSEQF